MIPFIAPNKRGYCVSHLVNKIENISSEPPQVVCIYFYGKHQFTGFKSIARLSRLSRLNTTNNIASELMSTSTVVRGGWGGGGGGVK